MLRYLYRDHNNDPVATSGGVSCWKFSDFEANVHPQSDKQPPQFNRDFASFGQLDHLGINKMGIPRVPIDQEHIFTFTFPETEATNSCSLPPTSISTVSHQSQSCKAKSGCCESTRTPEDCGAGEPGDWKPTFRSGGRISCCCLCRACGLTPLQGDCA